MTASKRDPNRVAVRVDGRVAATVSVRSIAALRLAVGDECDASLLVELERAASDDKAMRQAISRLGRRAMSRGQLERKLAELGYDKKTCERVLDRLGDIGLIDDRALQKHWCVRSSVASPPVRGCCDKSCVKNTSLRT